MRNYSYTLTTAPTVQPLKCSDLKDYAVVCHNEDDELLNSLIYAATDFIQEITGRQFIQATWTMRMDGFPYDEILIKKFPISSVTSITYIDTNGDSQTWSSSLYQTDLTTFPARIKPAYGQAFPAARNQYNSVTIVFVAGEGTTPDAVPQKIKQTIALLVNHWYRNNELIGSKEELPFSLTSLIQNLQWDER